eukprot:COSAG02_NODE_11876_length_1636_cov_6.214704_1_plen_83_part_10
MGCGSSIQAHEPRLIETTERKQHVQPVQHLVNRVNLKRDSLSFIENRWQDPNRYRLGFSFDAAAAGQASVFFGCGGPTTSKAD